MTDDATRLDDRRPDRLWRVHFALHHAGYAEGSVLIEMQGTVQGASFSRETLDPTVDLAAHGIADLIERQREAPA